MIAKEQLEELYIKQNKNRREIAKELNVSINRVDFYLEKYHISRKKRFTVYISYEELYDLYITQNLNIVEIGKMFNITSSAIYHKLLKYNIMYYLQKYLKKEKNKILIVGLGNRNIVADALGPIVINHIEVNNHLEENDTKVAAVSLGVMAQTGMETSDLLTSICNEFKPNLVILIDALATKNIKRINKSVQLNDVSISPGSGVFNFRKEINMKTLNAPLISLGVATVVEAYSIIKDTILFLEEKDYFNKRVDMHIIEDLLPSEDNFFVTPKSIDSDIEILGNIIARAINKACKEWKNEEVHH